MKKNIVSAVLFSAAMFIGSVSIASAHVSVKPNEAKVGAFTSFSVGVPVERDVPTVAIRLVIPEGLNHVTPVVKPGWKIEVKRGAASGEGEHADEAAITEITWSGNEIPAGFRDDFGFSAQVPTSATTLQWKAYQTYKDGAVVSWDLAGDQQPKDAAGKPDFSKSGPYSETKVIDDLKNTDAAAVKADDTTGFRYDIMALVVSVVALGLTFVRRRS